MESESLRQLLDVQPLRGAPKLVDELGPARIGERAMNLALHVRIHGVHVKNTLVSSGPHGIGRTPHLEGA